MEAVKYVVNEWRFEFEKGEDEPEIRKKITEFMLGDEIELDLSDTYIRLCGRVFPDFGITTNYIVQIRRTEELKNAFYVETESKSVYGILLEEELKS